MAFAMKKRTEVRNSDVWHIWWRLLLILSAPFSSQASAPETFTIVPSVRIEQGWDSNVFLQDVGDLADESSWLTTVQVGIRATWNPSDWARFEAVYEPRRVEFHEVSSESHFVHPIQLNLRGAADAWSWSLTNALTLTDGPHLGPRYTAPGGSPAIGGFTVRDRRDAAVLKQAARLQWKRGGWLVRGVSCAYVHNFMSELLQEPGYANYVDRQNVNGGIDVGRQGPGWIFAILGYRYGDQSQDSLFGAPETYSNRYHRVLGGIEGTPAPWLDLALQAGPTFHNFYDAAPGVFRGRHTRFFSDSSVTVRPSRADTIQLAFGQFEQVNSSGCGAYQDLVARVVYAHRFGDAWEVRGSFEEHRGKFEAPVIRNDRIHTAGVEATWHPAKGWDVTARGGIEWSDSAVPNTPAREYTREYLSLGVGARF